MVFTTDVSFARVQPRRRRAVGRTRQPTLMPMWLSVALVVALLVAMVTVLLAATVTLVAAAGSAVVGGGLVLAFLAVVNTLTPFAFVVLAARCVGVALVARVVPAAFEVLMVAEACFYLYYRLKARRWRRVQARGPRMSHDERRTHFERVLDTTPDMEAYIRGWFRDQPPLSAIRHDNVVEWLAWAFFDLPTHQMSQSELQEATAMMALIRQRHGLCFESGYNRDIRSVRLSIDHHTWIHRPLVYYAVIYLMDVLAGLLLRGMGFKRYAIGGGNPNFYWHRPAPKHGTHGRGLFSVVATAWRRLATLPSFIASLPDRLVYVVRPVGQPSDTDTEESGAEAQGQRTRPHFRWGSPRPRAPAYAPLDDSDDEGGPVSGGGQRDGSARPRATTGTGLPFDSDDDIGGSAGEPSSMSGSAGEPGYPRDTPASDGRHGGDNVVVFFHGIGIGVTAYLPLIWGMLSLRQATCVVEVPNISTRWVRRITTRAQVVGCVGTMLHRHGHKKATLVGHSFGSIHAAWVIRDMPGSVLGSVFLDPVCFMLAEPDVCHNFMYRRPSNIDELGTCLLASTELHISHSIGRHFFWHQNVLWHEQLPYRGRRTTVLLSGRDAIVPSAKVRAYLERRDVEVMFYPHLTHGSFMASTAIRWRVIQAVAKQHNCLDDLAHSLGTAALFWMSDDWSPRLGRSHAAERRA